MEYTITDALTGEHIVTGDATQVEEALMVEFSDLISLGRDDIRRAIENWRDPENADFLAVIIE